MDVSGNAVFLEIKECCLSLLMIEVKPKIVNSFPCPECGSNRSRVNDVIIQSLHVMADCSCDVCHCQFFHLLPMGHNVDDQLSIGKTTRTYYSPDNIQSWLFDSVVKAHEGLRSEKVGIEKRVFRSCRNVVILNTLDYLYGHVLLKLYNSLYHLDNQKHLGLILIIPRMFEWLIPQGCAEAWIVDLKLNQLEYSYESIQKFVSIQFDRFDTVYLSKAYSHPDFTKIDISRLTGVTPFDLRQFRQQKPVVTFVLREDRWWLASVADYWFYRICRKLKILTWGGKILTRRQNQLVKKATRRIRRELKDVEFFFAGLGETGNFSRYGRDERTTKIDTSIEKGWCQIYAKSHLIIGVHGSNMLLPTALAAGCVEILPEERYGNMVQDISVRYSDRRQLFFYRFADQYASPRSIARKALAMIAHYDIYHRNMCLNQYTS